MSMNATGLSALVVDDDAGVRQTLRLCLEATGIRVLGVGTTKAALEALERGTDGATGSPLLVPYLGDAIAALREGRVPGETSRLPSVADSFEAHVTALRLTCRS